MSSARSSAADPLGTEAGRRELLQTIVEITRAVFAAKACSLLSHDPSSRELVFEAVAGEGADTLVGQRIAATTGLAGWSLASEEPIAVEDVKRDPRWARDFAEETGYVPTRLSVHPLLHRERSLGVLEVLDQGASKQVGLADMDVLARIATHGAAVLALVQEARRGRSGGAGSGALSGLQQALAEASVSERDAAMAVIEGLERLLRAG
jgi:signal transduction protein with GAF and PtsI domain